MRDCRAVRGGTRDVARPSCCGGGGGNGMEQRTNRGPSESTQSAQTLHVWSREVRSDTAADALRRMRSDWVSSNVPKSQFTVAGDSSPLLRRQILVTNNGQMGELCERLFDDRV